MSHRIVLFLLSQPHDAAVQHTPSRHCQHHLACMFCPLRLAVAPFLCHPNLWIRYGAVGFITVIAQHLNVADVYCKLMPHLNPFITQPIIQVSPPPPLHHPHHHCTPSSSSLCLPPQIDKELVLLSVLKEPVSRSIFDYALRSKDIASLFRHLLLRQKKRVGSIPECPTPEDPAIAQLLKKLLSQVRIRLLSHVIYDMLGLVSM